MVTAAKTHEQLFYRVDSCLGKYNIVFRSETWYGQSSKNEPVSSHCKHTSIVPPYKRRRYRLIIRQTLPLMIRQRCTMTVVGRLSGI